MNLLFWKVTVSSLQVIHVNENSFHVLRQDNSRQQCTINPPLAERETESAPQKETRDKKDPDKNLGLQNQTSSRAG